MEGGEILLELLLSLLLFAFIALPLSRELVALQKSVALTSRRTSTLENLHSITSAVHNGEQCTRSGTFPDQTLVICTKNVGDEETSRAFFVNRR